MDNILYYKAVVCLGKTTYTLPITTVATTISGALKDIERMLTYNKRGYIYSITVIDETEYRELCTPQK